MPEAGGEARRGRGEAGRGGAGGGRAGTRKGGGVQVSPTQIVSPTPPQFPEVRCTSRKEWVPEWLRSHDLD